MNFTSQNARSLPEIGIKRKAHVRGTCAFPNSKPDKSKGKNPTGDLLLGVAAVELLNTTGCIDKLAFSGVERMIGGINL